MKLGVIIITTAFCLGFVAAVPVQKGGDLAFTCPRDDVGCITGLFPDAYNCSRFWQCFNCIAYHQDCPAGLHFSPEIMTCIRIEDAQCEVSPSPGTGTTPLTTTTSTTQSTTQSSTQSTTTTTPSTTSTTQSTTTSQTQSTTPSSTSSTSPSPPGFANIFSVARTSTLDDYYEPIEFDTVLANVGGRYSDRSHTFVPQEDGVYLFALSMGVQALKEADFNLRGGTTNIDVYRASTSHNGVDTTGRDIIMRVERSSIVRMASSPFTGLYGDQWLQTSWSGVQLDALMTPLVAFSMGRTEGYETPGRVPLPTMIYTSDLSIINPDEGSFQAPVSGAYYFSLTIGVYPSFGARVHLRVNGARLVELWRGSSGHNGEDTLSRATMVLLAAGDVVDVALQSGYIYSDGEMQISLIGFLYQPRFEAVAWSVHRSTSWLSDGLPLYPVVFGTVLANVGNHYDVSEQRFVCPTSGYYFLHINTGLYARIRSDFAILRNGVPIANIYRNSVAHNEEDIIGKGLVYYLRRFDILQVAAAEGTGIYSDSDLQTSFTGFLLYPE